MAFTIIKRSDAVTRVCVGSHVKKKLCLCRFSLALGFENWQDKFDNSTYPKMYL